jgi:S1-C subfamily serine protease
MRVPIQVRFALACAPLLILLNVPGCDGEPASLGGPVAVVQGKPPTHGMLGVEFAQTGPLEIVAVLATSPAEQSGLSAGDRITSINGQPVGSLPELQEQLKKTSPGATAHLSVTRENEARSVHVRLLNFGEVIALRQRSDGGRRGP